jgi:hypothetical protein
MTHGTFRFDEAPNTAVMTCRHIIAGAPIVLVSHDVEGDWQFLCEQESHDSAHLLIVCLGHLTERDPSINDVASMCTGHHAERANRAAPWTVVDEHESFIVKCIEDPGWSVQLIAAGETAAEPAFAYTIGLFHNYRQPELIVLGLRHELMQSMLDTLGQRIKAGHTFSAHDRVANVIADFDVTLRAVTHPQSFKEHVGYARWFYKGNEFPLFQVVWPDKQARFPAEPGTTDAFNRQQPLLP